MFCPMIQEMESPWLNESLTKVIRENTDSVTMGSDIARDLVNNKLKLVTLVEKLGDVLTDPDPKLRCHGTEVLADVVSNLPKDFLPETDLKFIAAFFIDRLVDHYSVIPAALRGILSIVEMEFSPHDIALPFLKRMFQHVQCQSLITEDRRCVYNIFRVLMHKYTQDLQTLGPDFVSGFMNVIDQEKDARNLTIIFEMLPPFIKTFPLGHLREEMFEIISCYFPVDYRPEYSNCPVSREELSKGLQNCLVASPGFAEFCLPLLIEKLDSKLKLAKLDSFKVLIAGCEVFSVDDIKTYLLELWQIIQHEVLPGSDKDVREFGLSGLKAIIKKMSEGAILKKDPRVLTNVTSFVLRAGINSLGEVELNLFLPAVRMMLTVAEASPASCLDVCKMVLPVLMKQYYRESGKEQKMIVLRALTSFVAVCEVQKISSIYCSEMSSVWQELPSLFLGAAQTDFPEVRTEGFHGLSVSGKILDLGNRDILYELLKKSILEEDDRTVRSEMLLCLKEISKMYPNEVVQTIVDVKLKDIFSQSEDDIKHAYLVLEALCEIADTDPFTSLIVPSILLFIVESLSLEKCNIGVKCLRKLLESCGKSKVYEYMYLRCEVVTRLTSWWLKGISERKCPTIFENEDLLCNSAKVVNIIITNQEERVQTDVVSLIMPQIVSPNNNFTNGFSMDCTPPRNLTVVIVLLEAILGSLRRSIVIPDFHKLVLGLVKVAINSSHDLTHFSACRLSANIINKRADDENLQKLLGEIFENLQRLILENASPMEKNCVNIVVWITKSLFMRGHSGINKWVEFLISLLAKPVIGEIAAKGFSLIMKEDVEYLNSENFCNIRILYRQRFFSFSPMLIEAFHNAGSDFKINYLVALGHMLQGVPQEVLLMNLEKMIPLLVESLQQPDAVLLNTTLGTLYSVLQKSDLALKDNLQTFIPHILTLTKFYNNMNVRIKALQCMYQICNYPTPLILPFKKQVLKTLGECLDDHKRLVRQEAVKARSHWFLVGTRSKQH